MRARSLGTALTVALAAAVAATGASSLPSPAKTEKAAFTSGYFKTPSGNIQCDYGYPGRFTMVRCGIKSGLRPPPPRRGPGCTVSNRVGMGPTGRARTGRSICPGEDEGDAGPFAEGQPVLAYGKSWSAAGLRCTSARAGLTCRNKSGHGWFLSRARSRLF